MTFALASCTSLLTRDETKTMLDRLIEITSEIRERMYPDCTVVFLAGSLVRGEATHYSDLDLVVIFEKLPNAFRESFHSHGFPVEVFVHDPETLNYFMTEVDRASGIPALAQMIVEGIEIPQPTSLSRSMKQLAASVIESGPRELDEEEIRSSRYNLTNLIDDIRHPRSREELLATATELYGVLANYYLRVNNRWSGKGKSIPRVLQRDHAQLWRRYCDSFNEVFVNGEPDKVISLAEEILKPQGGSLFDGYKVDAPAEYRKPTR